MMSAARLVLSSLVVLCLASVTCGFNATLLGYIGNSPSSKAYNDLAMISTYDACIIRQAYVTWTSQPPSGIYSVQSTYNCTSDGVTYKSVTGDMFGDEQTGDNSGWIYFKPATTKIAPDCIRYITFTDNPNLASMIFTPVHNPPSSTTGNAAGDSFNVGKIGFCVSYFTYYEGTSGNGTYVQGMGVYGTNSTYGWF